MPVKIYIVNGRKVWLDKAPEGAEEVKPVIKAEDPEAEPKAKPITANKARKTPANKSKKEGKTKNA